ncbi:MAG: putative manganese-dependent inorganic diphosphatase [Lachnospiraceae bacterium]|nr:putative manganese-dependent inorganic diphosphatase [Lachnospiraceae bacterium]
MTTHKRKITVIGHKNPDTDSICSAIAYAELKNKLTGSDLYVPRRAGGINAETRFVLNYFKIDVPELVEDVGTQVKDIQIREIEGVAGSISLKNAYTLMKEKNVVTLPIVTKDGYLEGLITIGDIATSYMDVYDSSILSKAKTSYRNIVETLDAELLVGDENALFDAGKVLVAAANPDLMEDYIAEHDLVITGNRYETQLCAIEMNAACIIICEGANVSLTIRKLAEAKGCTVLSTPHDTYTAARLINQSMPIEHFMIREKIDIFRTTDFVEEIREVMAKKRTRDFPILDTKGKYRGMVSRRNLLDMKKKQVILVDHNEKSQAADGVENTEILEIIDHHRLGTMETMSPVFFRNQPLGCTATIIYQMYQENQAEIPEKIAGLLCSAILSDTLMFRSPTCTPADKAAAEHLAKLAGIDVEAYANEMFLAGSDLQSKTEEEIFFQDYKKFSTEDVTFGVSQITSLNKGELDMIGSRIKPSLPQFRENQQVDMVFFMLTDIVKESTTLLFAGEDVEALLEVLYGNAGVEGSIELEGVVSRKKQLVPALIRAAEQI